ncbi:MAG: phosphoenolpyruvate synthase, partial [Actinomycetia bacterium]|nr:phosphoenolpyruvate synthase [Actinomycetes bacterium]
MATFAPLKPIIPLGNLRLTDTDIAGGKAANLGELIAAGFAVPGGFVVPAEVYLAAADGAGIREELRVITTEATTAGTEGLATLAARARNLIRSTVIDEATLEAIREALESLGPAVPVVVRSSATAEDTAETSFAGMNASFTSVIGLEQVAARVRDCWESLWGDRSVSYRASQALDLEPAIAVVVQAMVDSDTSGVMFTVDPAHGDESVLVVEAAFGLGEVVVSGAVEPDTYLVDRSSLGPRQIRIGHKSYRLARGPEGDQRQELGEEDAWRRVLTDQQISEVAGVGVRIEEHYGCPQDIEFAYVGDNLHILQSRPITTLAADDRTGGDAVLHGLGVGTRAGVGRVRVLHSPKEGHLLQDGEVLVAEMTAPDWLPTLRRSAAIITDAGGSTCHAAIVSRELGIPGVVGTREATKVLRDG